MVKLKEEKQNENKRKKKTIQKRKNKRKTKDKYQYMTFPPLSNPISRVEPIKYGRPICLSTSWSRLIDKMFERNPRLKNSY